MAVIVDEDVELEPGIDLLCGEVRRAMTWGEYADRWAPEETDLVIVDNPSENSPRSWTAGHVLALGDRHSAVLGHRAGEQVGWSSRPSQERELIVTDADDMEAFASASEQLVAAYADGPPPVFWFPSAADMTPLVTTSTGAVVAALYKQPGFYEGDPETLVVVVPGRADRVVWLRG